MLIAESATLLPTFRQILASAFSSSLFHNMTEPGEFVIDFSDHSRVYIENYGCSLDAIGWDEAEIAYIKQVLPLNHQVYSLAYRGIDAAKKVIIHLANSDRMMVDNDFGTLMVGTDFVRKVIAEPNWNWYEDLN